MKTEADIVFRAARWYDPAAGLETNAEAIMQIDILTLFPAMFDGPLTESILKRAQEKGLLTLRLHEFRDYATDKHRTVDDTPYGGGGGMVMMPGPLVAAIEGVRGPDAGTPVILLTPQGRVFTQKVAQELAGHPRLILVCGRYEGVDERVRQSAVTDEISIGDFVITGGELAAMIIVDAVARLIPGVLGARWGAEEDSHAMGLLEYPHYTRPPEFRGMPVPDVLLNGDHAAIEAWRRREAIRRTWQRRPDLLLSAELSEAERWYLADLAESDVPVPGPGSGGNSLEAEK
jgi:tRNA (guanine37-N1)-methyltransferase